MTNPTLTELNIAKLKDAILKTVKDVMEKYPVIGYGDIELHTPLPYHYDIFKKYTDEIADDGYLNRIKSNYFSYNSTAAHFKGYEKQYEEEVTANAESERKKTDKESRDEQIANLNLKRLKFLNSKCFKVAFWFAVIASLANLLIWIWEKFF